MLFDSWPGIGRTLLAGLLAYAALIVVLRATGKRTLSKWNAFDFVVTIALGSTLASTMLSKDVSVVEGSLAMTLLVVLQYVVTWLTVRTGWVQRLVKAEPTLLLYRGRLRTEALRGERVTPSEVRAALRAHGIGRVADAAAVVLETDGTFSVIRTLDGEATSLEGVQGYAAPAPDGRRPSA